jgi:hypothetical protein
LEAQFEFISEPENITKMELNKNTKSAPTVESDGTRILADATVEMEATLAQFTALTTPVPTNTIIVNIKRLTRPKYSKVTRPTPKKFIKRAVAASTLPPNIHCLTIREEFNAYKLRFYEDKPNSTFLEFISHLNIAKIEIMKKMFLTSLRNK